MEALEPGVHQFLPVQIVGDKGEPPIERFYFNICGRFDVIDPSKNAHIGIMRNADGTPEYYTTPGNTDWPLFSDRIPRRHFWRDIYAPDGHFVSDTAANALKTLRPRGVTFFKCIITPSGRD